MTDITIVHHPDGEYNAIYKDGALYQSSDYDFITYEACATAYRSMGIEPVLIQLTQEQYEQATLTGDYPQALSDIPQ